MRRRRSGAGVGCHDRLCVCDTPRYGPRMADAPVTLEGWYTLHEMYGVDWGRWNALADAERAGVVAEADAAVRGLVAPDEGHTALYSLLSQKGDLCLVHWRRDLPSLRAAELGLARTRLRSYLVPTYSYLAVIELGTYELMGHAGGIVKKRGIEEDSPDFEPALR